MDNKITFAHLADLHLGGWREKTLTELNFTTFQKSIDKVIDLNVDFCLFAGDIFNNPMPPLDLVQKVVKELMRLKEKNIPLYVIGGSHDFSHTGKSFIHLLETACVFVDVAKVEPVDKGKVKLCITTDENTNTNICGILGKKNGLDKNIYTNLNEIKTNSNSFNIFMFHCTLNDIKPDFMKAVKSEVTSSLLPKGFDYYAGGHVHTHIDASYDSGRLSYPGPLFPNNFSEMKREKPTFNYCTFDKNSRKTTIERVFLDTYETSYISIEFDETNPALAREQIFEKIQDVEVENKIVLLEISGTIDGKISELELTKVMRQIYEKGAIQILKNTYKLTPLSLKNISVDPSKDIKTLENEIILEFLKESNNKNEETSLLNSLLSLDLEKKEGEKVYQYEQRVGETIKKALNKSNP